MIGCSSSSAFQTARISSSLSTRASASSAAVPGPLAHFAQDAVSRLEQRSDLLISTLRNYVEAMGGDLQLIARFPDRQPSLSRDWPELNSRNCPV
jgi:hypothetical protein